jgi:hypothetical protein
MPGKEREERRDIFVLNKDRQEQQSRFVPGMGPLVSLS